MGIDPYEGDGHVSHVTSSVTLRVPPSPQGEGFQGFPLWGKLSPKVTDEGNKVLWERIVPYEALRHKNAGGSEASEPPAFSDLILPLSADEEQRHRTGADVRAGDRFVALDLNFNLRVLLADERGDGLGVLLTVAMRKRCLLYTSDAADE